MFGEIGGLTDRPGYIYGAGGGDPDTFNRDARQPVNPPACPIRVTKLSVGKCHQTIGRGVSFQDSPICTELMTLVRSSGRAATSGFKALCHRAPLNSGVLRVARGGSWAPPLAARSTPLRS